jgi:hypothetical protein
VILDDASNGAQAKGISGLVQSQLG